MADALTAWQLLTTPGVLGIILAALALAVCVWWWRERRQAEQRSVLRGIMRLSENLLDAPTPREILARLQKETPSLVGARDVELLLFEAGEDVLQQLSLTESDPGRRVPVDAPIGTFAGAAALCFRNRALLRIPDTRSSPILTAREPHQPRAAVFVPMFAQGELLGVLGVHLSRRTILAHRDQDVALQHLGNQIAASLKLQERQMMRDQLIRTEKMAAAGQLISAVANDLRGPLEAIGQNARRLSKGDTDGGLSAVAREADHGLEIIDHLLSFAHMEQRQAIALDLHALVSSLLELRAEENSRKGIRIENNLPVAPVLVFADQSQIEQAILTVIVHAEVAAASSSDRTLLASSRVIGRKVLLSFDVSRPAVNAEAASLREATGYPVAQVIIQSHGGDLRHVSDGRHGSRFEMELPVHDPITAPPETARHQERPSRVLTCLLIEPDMASQRTLLSALAERGHRAIPAADAEHAADLVQRMRFDAVFCSSVLSGLNWLELHRRIRRRVGAFALLTDAYDPETAGFFERENGRLLLRPVGQRELNDFLDAVGDRIPAAQN